MILIFIWRLNGEISLPRSRFLGDIDSQIMGTFSGDDVNVEIAEVRVPVLNENHCPNSGSGNILM